MYVRRITTQEKKCMVYSQSDLYHLLWTIETNVFNWKFCEMCIELLIYQFTIQKGMNFKGLIYLKMWILLFIWRFSMVFFLKSPNSHHFYKMKINKLIYDESWNVAQGSYGLFLWWFFLWCLHCSPKPSGRSVQCLYLCFMGEIKSHSFETTCDEKMSIFGPTIPLRCVFVYLFIHLKNRFNVIVQSLKWPFFHECN